MLTERLDDLIGDTPLYRFDQEIYFKMEFQNIGFSIKDRVAKHVINRAEEEGLVKPGTTIVEYSSGNLGIGLAMLAAERGYPFVCVAESSISEEKLQMLKAFGAEVVLADYYAGTEKPLGMMGVAKAIAASIPDAYLVNQYENPWNPEAHERYTAPEIHRDLPSVSAVFVGMGTGGIISGIGHYFKREKPDTRIIGVTPDSGRLYTAFHKSKEDHGETDTVIEGVGEDFLAPVLDFSVIDDVVEVADEDSVRAMVDCCKKGLFIGSSTGMVLAAARKYAISGPKALIAGDTGMRYLHTTHNPEWRSQQGYRLAAKRNSKLHEQVKREVDRLTQQNGYPRMS